MRTTLIVAVPLVVLAVASLSRSDEARPHAAEKAAQKAIIALSEDLDGPDLRERAAKIVREHDSDAISSVFMNTHRGGLGGGGLIPQTTYGDSVQRVVLTWMSRPPTAADFATKKEQMLRMTRVIRAMSELAPHRVPKNADAARAREWGEVAHEFHETALGLHRAVEKADADAIKVAARKLNNTCCHCHSLVD